MHHGYTIAGTAGGGASLVYAQVEAVRVPQGMPWWVPLGCAALACIPSVLAFVDKRLTERRTARLAARLRVDRPSIDRPDIPPGERPS